MSIVIKPYQNSGSYTVKVFTLLATLFFLLYEARADKYDDAVIDALNAPKVEDEVKEPDSPSYAETVGYIQNSLEYPLIEDSHCNFQYKDNSGDMLTISYFNAGDLVAIVDKRRQLECKHMSRCFKQDYWGNTRGLLYKTSSSSIVLEMPEYIEEKANHLAYSINHLVMLCGGSKEY